MSKLLKVFLAFLGSTVVATSIHAQATIEEVIVTAQRTEQSLQDVPIAVSAFTDEILSDRQIEVASDLQLQVPGVSYSADAFGSGGFSIRGVTNLAVSSSADAGVEVHVNGLPLGATSTNEIGFLDMTRIEVLRGPQGTLYGSNAIGGTIRYITNKPDSSAAYGKIRLGYGDKVKAGDPETSIEMMYNLSISDSLALRAVYSQLVSPGIYKNISPAERSGMMLSGKDFSWRLDIEKAINLSLIHI